MSTTTEAKIGNRRLRAGEIVKINRLRGTYTIQSFDLEAGTVDVFGGTPGDRGHRMFRVVTIDRIGARPVEANRRARQTAK